ncbi:MAG: PIG-L family deacetylase [Chloroflexi bacterium]|nr:PIG-L family deacetylase [Chloroflexota bacterium]
MRHIYLSAHLDDVAFSCGGLIRQQARGGAAVEVWTLCAGEPLEGAHSKFAESLHARWGLDGRVAVGRRRAEDRRACMILGADFRHFEIPDCIYRRGGDGRFLYDSEQAIFGALNPDEISLAAGLAERLATLLKTNDHVYCPLGVGRHVDHQLARQAAERLGRPLRYYADVPYVLQAGSGLGGYLPPEGATRVEPIAADAREAWVAACLAYASQVGSFWPDEAGLRAALAGYLDAQGGLGLWLTG